MNIKKFVCFLMSVAIFICMIAYLFSCGGGGDDASAGGSAGQSGTIIIEYNGPNGLSPTFPSIPADGTSSVFMHVTIRDSAGNPVRHYTDVNFTASLGHFRNGSSSYTTSTQPPWIRTAFRTPPPTPQVSWMSSLLREPHPGPPKSP